MSIAPGVRRCAAQPPYASCAAGHSPVLCVIADELLGLGGLHLLAVDRLEVGDEHPRGLTVQTDHPVVGACRDCGVLAADHGRREHRLTDAPAFATPVQLIWRKRRWRCREPRCPTGVWSEEHPALPARAKLSTRAIEWAVQTLRWDDSTVSALARQLGADWHTLMDAIRAQAVKHLDDDPARAARLGGVDTLGVDEHVWKPSARHRDRAVTYIVDLTRDEDGRIHARLLDVTLGRSGPVYATWLRDQPGEFVAGITHAALDPFHHTNGLRQRHPHRTPRRHGGGVGRPPRREARLHRDGRGPPPRSASHPGPARAPRRPALPDPAVADHGPGEPHRPQPRPPRGRAAGR